MKLPNWMLRVLQPLLCLGAIAVVIQGGLMLTSVPVLAQTASEPILPQQLLLSGLDQVRSYGAIAPIVFIGLYAIATVALIPGSVLTLRGGFPVWSHHWFRGSYGGSHPGSYRCLFGGSLSGTELGGSKNRRQC
ncbi:hypothetical protein [Neosynechococcus sphagnicola]|uniref:hypothetical protein n=1 Tax=Neosynechococcus sphagnicola TaxID=1501145 RepID=UPI001EF9DEC3|nr:hypothetical protein [Neosynechococcus sphagnicola]